MKDGLNPLGSQTAAALNHHELAKLQNHADIPQKLAESIGWISALVGGILIPKELGPLRPITTHYLSRLAGFAAQREELNLETLAYCFAHDLERLDKTTSELDQSIRNVNLLLQAIMEARYAASKERVERLAAVLISGLLRSNDSEEMVSEFLRLTSLLAESDVQVLHVTAKLQEPFGAVTNDEQRWRQKVFAEWPQILNDLVSGGVSVMSYRSAFIRLQGLGLVEPMDPGFGGGKPRFEVLELGRQYLSYLGER